MDPSALNKVTVYLIGGWLRQGLPENLWVQGHGSQFPLDHCYAPDLVS